MSSNALKKAPLLLLNQVVSRLFTFILNILVLRTVGAGLFGLASVNLYLVYTIILFLSREPLRKSTLQCGYGSSELIPTDPTARRILLAKTVTTTWLVLPAGILLSIFTYLISSVPIDGENTGYEICLLIYIASALIELTAEPLYVHTQRLAMVEVRVGAEASGNVVRCVVTYICAVWLEMGLFAFALGQLSFSIVYTIVYYTYLLKQLRSCHGSMVESSNTHSEGNLKFQSLSDAFPRFVDLDMPLLKLTLSFTVQSIEKLLLTEGEKLVMVWLEPLNSEQRGVYVAVQNLGSLVARFVFQPLEEASATTFAMYVRDLRVVSDLNIKNENEQSKEKTENDKSLVKSQDHNDNQQKVSRIEVLLTHLENTLVLLLQTVMLFGCVLMFFGPHYSLSLFDLLYGKAWSNTGAPATLGFYCFYTLFLALNGITEAFVYSAVTATQLSKVTVALLAFSAVYLGSCIVFLFFGFGLYGFIIANCIGMLCRIIYSLNWIDTFLSHYHKQLKADSDSGKVSLRKPLLSHISSLVHPAVGIVLFLSGCITFVSQRYFVWPLCSSDSYFGQGCDIVVGTQRFVGHALHIGVGGVCLVAVVITLLKCDQAFVQNFKNSVINKK